MPIKQRKPLEYGWQERTLTPLQYRRVLAELGLTYSAAARFLGVSYRTSTRYAHGMAEVPPAHALLLRAMIEFGQTPVVPYWSKP
jgi:transcriptional regulator with XRE-family HTH domain